MASKGFDISGMATKYNVQCADGRIIRTGAFADMDGKRVPLCWNHDHSDPDNVLGYAVLHSQEDGMRADAYFDDTNARVKGVKSKLRMGTPMTFSIHANQLKQAGNEVIHGVIREVSLVLAGANPGAVIDHMALAHSDGFWTEEEAIITFPDVIEHSLDSVEPVEPEAELEHADEKKEEKPVDENTKAKSEPEKDDDEDEETIEDVLNSMTDKQRDVTFALVGMAAEEKEGEKEMAHTNIFEEQGTVNKSRSLTHADKMQILEYADAEKSFQRGLQRWAEENLEEGDELSHGGIDNDAFTYLLPEFKNVNGEGNRDLWEDDIEWVAEVVNGAHKVPFARVKTETIDARGLYRAKGWKKGNRKNEMGDAKILHRETTPTMVYAKQQVNRQDILDLKGNFEYVPFIRQTMQKALKFELAYDTLFGDGREDGDDDKVREECIRPIWKDDEMFTIHVDLDVNAMAASLQGTDTNTYFGEGFVESEAMVKVILDTLIDYRGSGNMVAFMDPREVNKLLLARDRDGHRMYKSKAELATALNVRKIVEVQQIAELEPRVSGTGAEAKKKKLVALMVNMNDYAYGNVSGGEVTHFENFDIDYNNYKYLDETYLSGAMRKIKSAIAIETDVTDEAEG